MGDYVTTGDLVAIIFGALAVGALMGLIPLISGMVKNRKGLAIGGFVACVIAGFLLGIILALPTAIVFTLIIFLTKPKATEAVMNPYSPSMPAPPSNPYAPNPYAPSAPTPPQPVPSPTKSAGASMLCPNCGVQTENDAMFCVKCGKKLV